MTMPSAQLVNETLTAMGDLVPDLPDHDHEMGTGYPDLRGQVPVTLPPVVSDTSKRTGGTDAGEYRRPGTA
jgi:hypothetical protein